jgi:segregation and condensation protein A
MQFNEAAVDLSERDLLDQDVFTRRMSEEFQAELKNEEPLLAVNIFQLMDAFKRIVEQELPGAEITFRSYKWSVKERTEFLIGLLKEKKMVYFRELFREDKTVGEFVVTFLAVLELVHIGIVHVFQLNLDSDICIKAAFGEHDGNGEQQNA